MRFSNRPTLPSFLGVLATVLLLVPPVAHAAPAVVLTPEAAMAVEKLFPAARITHVERERERGVEYFEVAARVGERMLEIEVTPDGTIGEVETEVAFDELTPAAQEAIRGATGGAPIRAIEKHEIFARSNGNRFNRLDRPEVIYEVLYDAAGSRATVAVGADGRLLASAADDEEEDEDPAGDDDAED